MKKQSLRSREYQMRLSRYALEAIWKEHDRYRKSKTIRVEYQVVKAPGTFALGTNENRERVLHFLSKLREIAVRKKKSIRIDFSSTTRMISDGTLLFLAELCRVKRLVGGQVKFRCVPPRHSKVTQVLEQVGIFRQLNYRSKVATTHADVVHWRAANGHEVRGEKYDDVLGHYDGQITEALGTKFYLGVTEAMTNCHHHAYTDIRDDGLNVRNEQKDWWMFSQERDGILTVVFCDLGVGIPRTLPLKNPSLWQRVQQTFGSHLEAHAIREAIAESRTRTGMHHRGKGLKQLVDVVAKVKGGKVNILSNRGRYTLESDFERLHQYKSSILGTLIFWQVQLGAETNVTVGR